MLGCRGGSTAGSELGPGNGTRRGCGAQAGNTGWCVLLPEFSSSSPIPRYSAAGASSCTAALPSSKQMAWRRKASRAKQCRVDSTRCGCALGEMIRARVWQAVCKIEHACLRSCHRCTRPTHLAAGTNKVAERLFVIPLCTYGQAAMLQLVPACTASISQVKPAVLAQHAIRAKRRSNAQACKPPRHPSYHTCQCSVQVPLKQSAQACCADYGGGQQSARLRVRQLLV